MPKPSINPHSRVRFSRHLVGLTGMFLVAVTALLTSCEQAVGPPEPVHITDRGIALAEETVFALKGLRTHYDMVGITETFDFDWALLDSASVPTEKWLPSELDSLVQRSLAKKSAAQSELSKRLKVAFAESRTSVSTDMNFPHTIDTLLRDSLLAIDSTTLQVRFGLDSLQAGLAWDSAYDLVSGIWKYNQDSSELIPYLDTLFRFRFKDSTGVRITDQEKWASDGSEQFALFRKKQTHLSGIDTVYFHQAEVEDAVGSREIEDHFIIQRETGSAVITLGRTDNSSTWWSRPDSSILDTYKDSVATGNEQWNRLMLTDGTYYFTRSDTPQVVELNHLWKYDSGDFDQREMIYSQRIGEDGTSAELISYRRTDVLNNGQRASYELRNAFEAASPGSLLVSVTIPDPHRPQNQFGFQDSSFMVFTLASELGAGALEYNKLLRRDFYQTLGGERTQLDYVEWIYTPATPDFPKIGSFENRPVGTTIVTAFYATAPRTLARQWSLVDTSSVDELSYVWAGVERDSVRVFMKRERSTGDVSYAYDRPKGYHRSGQIEANGQRKMIRDTLRQRLSTPASDDPWATRPDDQIVRISGGAFDSTGYGSFEVTGIDTFTLAVTGDTLKLACGASGACPTGAGLHWRIQDTVFVATENHETYESETFTYTFALDGIGNISGGIVSKTDDDDVLFEANEIQVKPSYRGSAVLSGVFNDDQLFDRITADLDIALWSSNILAHEHHIR